MGYDGELEIALFPEHLGLMFWWKKGDFNKVLIGSSNAETANFTFLFELFENIAYAMAKHRDKSAPDSPEEWLDNFSTFSIYQILPELIELWGLT